jgi:hypothetical protein
MEEHFLSLESPKFETIVVILDASESAENDWAMIVDSAKKIFQKTPAEIKKRLFFLGNSQEYDIEDFEENVSLWRKQNNKRGSFISPVLMTVNNAKIVIIGSGIIYDLEDWADNHKSTKILLVKMSESMRGTHEIGTEIDKDSFDGHQLANPIHSIQIDGEDFMPYYWDNPDYSVSFEGSIALNSSNLKNYSINIAAFGTNIKAKITKSEGKEKISLTSAESHSTDIIELIETNGKSWEKLSSDEEKLFNEHTRADVIKCPTCGCVISGPLRCHNEKGSILGKPIYNSLKEIRGFVIFKDLPEGIYYKQYNPEIIRIDENSVAINKKAKSVIYRYDTNKKKWIQYEDLKPYYPLKGGYYVSIT